MAMGRLVKSFNFKYFVYFICFSLIVILPFQNCAKQNFQINSSISQSQSNQQKTTNDQMTNEYNDYAAEHILNPPIVKSLSNGDCEMDGVIVKNNENIVGYLYPEVPSDSYCISKRLRCSNGILYNYDYRTKEQITDGDFTRPYFYSQCEKSQKTIKYSNKKEVDYVISPQLSSGLTINNILGATAVRYFTDVNLSNYSSISNLSTSVESQFPTYICKIVGGNLLCGSKSPSLYYVGDGKTTTANQLVEILSGGVKKFVFGTYHRCALKDQDVYCWGKYPDSNFTSVPVIGDGTSSSLTPKKIISGVSDLVAANNMTCVIINGALKCWGDLPLDLNLSRKVSTPLTIINDGVIKVAMDRNGSICALTTTLIRCYGWVVNSGTSVDISLPGNQSSDDISQISVGLNRLCIIKNGALYCSLNKPSGFGSLAVRSSAFVGEYHFRYPTAYPYYDLRLVSCYQSGVVDVNIGQGEVYVFSQSGSYNGISFNARISRFFDNSCEPNYISGSNYSIGSEIMTEMFPFNGIVKLNFHSTVNQLCFQQSGKLSCLGTDTRFLNRSELLLNGDEQQLEYW